jgi:hypothetical protein
MEYKFIYNEKEYTLNMDNLDSFANDEEVPVEGIDEEQLLELMSGSDSVEFDVEYFGAPCPCCDYEKAEKPKAFKFLEYRFYIYTKEGKYVISSISKEYENTSYNKLTKAGKVDNSYVVSVIVCIGCGKYVMEIEQCEI